ncbi:MAG: hypothetical protein V4616_14660 [Bacteroidota bacterium]
MGRITFPLVFLVLFIGWILFHLVVRKDLRKQKNTLYFGLFFFGVWGLIYSFLLD